MFHCRFPATKSDNKQTPSGNKASMKDADLGFEIYLKFEI